jgi:hypothetical protein
VGGETRLQADADLGIRTYHGDRLLAFPKSPHRKQTKVVEADARATQPGFRLTPSFSKGGDLYQTTMSFFHPIIPYLISRREEHEE